MVVLDASQRYSHLEVRQGSIQFHAPINKTIGSVQDAIFVQAAESFNNGFGEFLILVSHSRELNCGSVIPRP